MDNQDYYKSLNVAHYEAIFPGMTEEQALFIMRQPYGTYPQDVTTKASVIAQGVQEEYASLMKNK